MSNEITLDELRKLAAQAGLELSEEELERVLPGVNRARSQISELRRLVSDSLEPPAIFLPSEAKKPSS
jgi:Asp-tRNA(Asn)/Glu-tRNA(Gln) amidotransferase C subunit